MSPPVSNGKFRQPFLERWVALFLVLITLAVFYPVRRHGFIPLDDTDYVLENAQVLRGFTVEGAGWAFTRFHAGNWHPLTWLSHMLDCELGGVNAGWHHLTSVLFHAVNTLLLFLVLHRMTRALWRSALVAALFAWHPLHIQSVAWIAERKDVLSAFFWMLTLAAYVGYVRRPHWFRYATVTTCFALGLMAKPMLVSLPVVLLLLDFWPLGRLPASDARALLQALKPLLREKIPLFILAGASCLITLLAQQNAGAVISVERLPLFARWANAAVTYNAYLWKTIWPAPLSILYPYRPVFYAWQIGAAILLLVGVTWVVIHFAHRLPSLAVGWFWYLVTLVPVIGFVQVGTQAMADRYTYLPLIGIFIVAVWGIAAVLMRWRHGFWAGVMGGSALICLLIVGTTRELRHWENGEKLFTHALAVPGENAAAHNCLGNALVEQGRLPEAIREYHEALRIAPRSEEAHYNLAYALLSLQRNDEALVHLQEALLLAPRYARAYNNLGSALLRQRRLDEAMTQFQEAVRLEPDQPEFQFNLAGCLAAKGKLDEAVAHYEHAIRLRPDFADAHNNIGFILLSQGKAQAAAAHCAAALRAKPDYINAHVNLANALLALASPEAAATHYQTALRLNPDALPALRDFAWMRASHPYSASRDGAEAIRLAERAVTLTSHIDPTMLDVLAAAYAEAGRFDEAVATASQAQTLAAAKKQSSLAAEIDVRLQLYRTSLPYRKNY